MDIITTPIKDLLIIKPKVYCDQRGSFFESYNKQRFFDHDLKYDFVQDNCSFSKKGTLRGLHFQKGEYSQAKLITCLQGKILDVAVDLRKNSETFGKHFSLEIDSEEASYLLIPSGFAHGFIVLSEQALFSYKCDNFYAPKFEEGIIYNDSDLKIDWVLKAEEINLSEKDKKNKSFKEVIEKC